MEISFKLQLYLESSHLQHRQIQNLLQVLQAILVAHNSIFTDEFRGRFKVIPPLCKAESY